MEPKVTKVDVLKELSIADVQSVFPTVSRPPRILSETGRASRDLLGMRDLLKIQS